jgi:CheY-specific phosphatase CheX
MSEIFNAERAVSVLADSVSSVFADMAFIDVERAKQSETSGLEPASETERRAVIDVLSPLSCRIELTITTALRDRILDTLFGDLDKDEQRKTAEDPLLEMLNIIAGSFLSAYFGPGTDIQLELPRYLYFSESAQGQPVSSITLDAEGEPLKASISSVRYRY